MCPFTVFILACISMASSLTYIRCAAALLARLSRDNLGWLSLEIPSPSAFRFTALIHYDDMISDNKASNTYSELLLLC